MNTLLGPSIWHMPNPSPNDVLGRELVEREFVLEEWFALMRR